MFQHGMEIALWRAAHTSRTARTITYQELHIKSANLRTSVNSIDKNNFIAKTNSVSVYEHPDIFRNFLVAQNCSCLFESMDTPSIREHLGALLWEERNVWITVTIA
jgi:hypothetical protein